VSTSSDNPSRFQVSLRIWHPSADPLEIGRELEWAPEASRKAGEPRTTLKGNPLPGLNKESFWYAVLPVTEESTLSSVIGATNRRLISRKHYLASLVSTGGVLEYFIGWFIDSNVGECIDWETLLGCGELKIRLQFDVYPPDTEPLPPPEKTKPTVAP